MTLEEFSSGEQKTERMDKVGDALEEVLSKALSQRTITVGVYEAAKLLNVDPDNVVLCLLAADEDDDRDVALQIHFTLIQAFCCENDINILRVSNPGRLAELLLLETDAGPAASEGAEQPPDLHCVLVTSVAGLSAEMYEFHHQDFLWYRTCLSMLGTASGGRDPCESAVSPATPYLHLHCLP
uniref:Growth arrest and DNA damage-inducible protein GADD45 alpha n=1 Tax=Callithrix jacchus TaxID=9483 RepID=A0A8I4A396_CALJA